MAFELLTAEQRVEGDLARIQERALEDGEKQIDRFVLRRMGRVLKVALESRPFDQGCARGQGVGGFLHAAVHNAAEWFAGGSPECVALGAQILLAAELKVEEGRRIGAYPVGITAGLRKGISVARTDGDG